MKTKQKIRNEKYHKMKTSSCGRRKNDEMNVVLRYC